MYHFSPIISLVAPSYCTVLQYDRFKNTDMFTSTRSLTLPINTLNMNAYITHHYFLLKESLNLSCVLVKITMDHMIHYSDTYMIITAILCWYFTARFPIFSSFTVPWTIFCEQLHNDTPYQDKDTVFTMIQYRRWTQHKHKTLICCKHMNIYKLTSILCFRLNKDKMWSYTCIHEHVDLNI